MGDHEESKEEIFPPPDEDDYDLECEDLNLSLADDASGILSEAQNNSAAQPPSDTNCCAAASNYNDDDFVGWNEDEYILGTLIVRVVAARNLEAVNKNGIPSMLFGERRSHHHHASAGTSGGTSNPYASVRFGNTTQRTSQVYGTTEPVWPRGETMYMDVMHPSVEPTVEQQQTEPTKSEGSSQSDTMPSSNDTNAEFSKQPHPGDPPPKTSNFASSQTNPPSTHGASESEETPSLSPPLLTIAVFHASDTAFQQPAKYNPSKPSKNGDSDDTFLGLATLNLTPLFTGRIRQYDDWLPIAGAGALATVRVVCEYETSDAPPAVGDHVQFTHYCEAADLYPALHNRLYSVSSVLNNDEVLVSWTKEGWVSTFCVHRCMLMVVQRNYSVVDACQDELASIRERISHSPMVHAVKDTLDKVPEEGLIAVSADLAGHVGGLFSRWVNGGIGVTTQDLNFATNWDGSHTPQLSAQALHNLSLGDEEEEEQATPAPAAPTTTTVAEAPSVPALPNMPPCPITGEPMREPVVAADGHTYEKNAMARWLLESNKSPLTGAVLPHKDLVPNYMLLSSLQDAASKQLPETDEDVTSEVSLVEE